MKIQTVFIILFVLFLPFLGVYEKAEANVNHCPLNWEETNAEFENVSKCIQSVATGAWLYQKKEITDQFLSKQKSMG